MRFGQKIQSLNKKFIFEFRNDGNVGLIYQGKPLFTTATANMLKGDKKSWRLTFQNDAQLVLFDGNNTSIWSSGINGARAHADDQNQRIILQDDGNLVQFTSQNKAIFQTQTNSGRQAQNGGTGLDYCGNLSSLSF